MLAANQGMIGKCLKLQYSWKRSSVQVQSKRNFKSVSHKLRERNHQIRVGPCVHKDKVVQDDCHCREMGLGLRISFRFYCTP